MVFWVCILRWLFRCVLNGVVLVVYLLVVVGFDITVVFRVCILLWRFGCVFYCGVFGCVFYCGVLGVYLSVVL